jgi:hypothetical protein
MPARIFPAPRKTRRHVMSEARKTPLSGVSRASGIRSPVRRLLHLLRQSNVAE